jgi:hypothetical protein
LNNLASIKEEFVPLKRDLQALIGFCCWKFIACCIIQFFGEGKMVIYERYLVSAGLFSALCGF